MASIKKDGGFNSFPIAYRRGNPIALDTTAVWYSKEELEAYATSGATAYVGQVVTLVNETANTCEAYMIADKAGTLVKLAQTTASGDLAGDVATLQTQVNSLISTVNGTGKGESHVKGLVEKVADLEAVGATKVEASETNGKIKINGTDTKVYELPSEVVKDAQYKRITVSAKNGVTAAGGETYKYDDTDLSNRIAEFEANGAHDVAALEGRVTTVENSIGDSTKGIIKDISDLKTNKLDASVYNTYVGTHSYTDTQIDAKVAGLWHFEGTANGAPTDNNKNILVGDTTVAATASNKGAVYIYDGKEYASNGSEWIELGFGTDLSSYYTSAQVDTKLADKVDKVEGSSLMTSEEHTKLAGIAENATKVEASTNGNIKINGTDTKVYELPSDVARDAAYKHITVTESSVSDGTKTFTKYDDTALSNRVKVFEANGVHDVAALEAKVGAPKSGDTAATGLYAEIEKANNATGTLALTAKHVTTAYSNVTEMVQSVDTEVHANKDAIEVLNGSGEGSVAKAISDKVGDLRLTNSNHTTTTYSNVSSALDAIDSEIHAVNGRVDGLGTLANKSKVTETDLATALASKINGKADKATTLAGYGITDAKIEGNVITLGSGTITPVTSLAGYATETYVGQQIGELKIGETTYSTAKGYIDAKVEEAKSDTSTLAGRVTTVEETLNGKAGAPGVISKLATAESNISTLNSYFENGIAKNADKLDNHDSTYFATAQGLTDAVGTAGKLSGTNNETATGGSGIYGEITKLQAKDNGQDAKITALEGTIGSASSGLVKDVADLKTTVGNSNSGLVKDVADLKAVGATKVEASTTNGNIKINGTETPVYTLPSDIVAVTVSATEGVTAKGVTYKYDDTELTGKVSSLETKVGDNNSGLVKDVSDLKSKITGLTGAMHFIGTVTNAVTDGGTENPGIQGSGASGALAAGDIVLYGSKEFIWDGSKWELFGDEGSYAVKATTLAGYGITDAYTKTEVDTELAKKVDKVAGSSLMTSAEHTKLEGIAEGATKVESSTNGNIKINGTDTKVYELPSDIVAVTVSATEGVTAKGVTYKYDDTALSNRIKVFEAKGAHDVAALEGRVKAIEDLHPEENVLEGVQVAGTDLAIDSNKKVNIPLATLTAVGVVKGVEDTVDNGVQVAADGAMSVKRVNCNTLVQTDGEFVIINGGNAALSA